MPRRRLPVLSGNALVAPSSRASASAASDWNAWAASASSVLASAGMVRTVWPGSPEIRSAASPAWARSCRALFLASLSQILTSGDPEYSARASAHRWRSSGIVEDSAMAMPSRARSEGRAGAGSAAFPALPEEASGTTSRVIERIAWTSPPLISGIRRVWKSRSPEGDI